MAKKKMKIKPRLLFVLLSFTALFVAIGIRVLWIQTVDGAKYKSMAFAQQSKGQIISPKRGVIYDRNGKELAVNIPVKTITMDPSLVGKGKSKMELDSMAGDMAEIFKLDKEGILKKLKKSSKYEVLAKKVSIEMGDALKKWASKNKISGIYIEDDTKRYYPNRNLASHVLGFTGAYNQGLSGIELSMERYLKGQPGKILSEVDDKGLQIPFAKEEHIDVQDGLNVALTIDKTIQYTVETALKKGVEDYKVLNGASAIVMDPRNGEVLAMASYPDFDLNSPFSAPKGIDENTWNSMKSEEKTKKLMETSWRNKAINVTYEPGSTFKTITAAAGLEEGVINPETQVVDVPIKVAGHTICSDMPGGHGKETFKQSLYNSDNPVFVKLSQSLGIDKFYQYVKAFGFYEITGIDLPGEAGSQFQKRLTEIDMATASFGQNFQITPIQLISAYASIANGGKLLKPHLIREMTDSNGNIVSRYEPELVRNVISKQTTDTLKNMLEGVVNEGTGTNAYINGYRVAGKTGTAETFEKGVRSADHYVASFSAFAPVDNPVVNVLVVLDYPSGKSHMGGTVAAPIAAKILEDTLEYLGVERKYTERDRKNMSHEINVPDVTKKSVKDAQSTLSALGLKAKVIGNLNSKDSIVMNQSPKYVSLPEGSIVILYTKKGDKDIKVKMPNLINKTVQECTQALADTGLNIKVKGTGVAVSQECAPDTEVVMGRVIEVEFVNELKQD